MTSREDSRLEIERALGRLTMSFSTCELYLANICRQLTGLPHDSPESMVMVAGLDMRTLVDKVCSLYKLRPLDAQDEKSVEDFRQEAISAIELRNKVVHGTWVSTGEETSPRFLFRFRAKAKRGLHHIVDFIDVANLDALTERFGKLGSALPEIPRRPEASSDPPSGSKGGS